MKKILFILTLFALQTAMCQMEAQPAQRRVQNNNRRTTTTSSRTGANRRTTTANRRRNTETKTTTVSRAELMFPTAVPMPKEVDWRRDLYRTLDLRKDENAALYYPVEPQGNQMNLFTLLFRLFNNGKIPVYEYYSEREDFSEARRLNFASFVEKFNIAHDTQNETIKVDDSNIPSADVLSYYVKESSYYDQNTATYHSRVVALCPVLHDRFSFGSDSSFSFGGSDDEGTEDADGEEGSASEDSGSSAVLKPLFWVKYDDIVTYLSAHTVMTSNINNAATMSMADFFDTNKYKGTIYMTNNMQGKLLAENVKPSEVKNEQARIEKQMTDFEQHIWTTPVDSAELARRDSIAKLESSKKRTVASSDTRRGTSSTGNTTVQKSNTKEKKVKSPSAPRVSVRRQRH